ncbi:hypothetical protein C7476_11198 [Phyllobacterium bourgognense]|uniref:Uncharacterized protein n=1 Tax=Phyllobacterium bourgognense TaxID=314236 RepID=A0A368YPM7_9HYPH|nr:hypothetical protein C7476_11198 [Phyllobacterium bourgognense]
MDIGIILEAHPTEPSERFVGYGTLTDRMLELRLPYAFHCASVSLWLRKLKASLSFSTMASACPSTDEPAGAV